MVTWNDFRKWLTDHDLPDPASAPVIKIEMVPAVNAEAAAAVFIVATACKLDANGKMIQPPDVNGERDFLTETHVRALASFPDETAG